MRSKAPLTPAWAAPSLRQKSRALTPSIENLRRIIRVWGRRLGIWAGGSQRRAGRRIPHIAASSRGGGKRHSDATAVGDDGSASVSASWLSTPRYPGPKGDDPPSRQRARARIAWAARWAIDAIERRSKRRLPHHGHSGNFFSKAPEGVFPTTPPAVEGGK